MFKALKWKEMSCVNEHIGEVGEEQQPARVKAPPQRRKSGDTCGINGTHDYVPGQQGLEDLGQEKIEELSFVPSAVSESR